MLKEIISITGKPGLYKIISSGNKSLIVEDLANGNRFPAGMRDKVVSLGDIAMYTTAEDLPLGTILERLYANMEGKKLDVKGTVPADKFAEIVPDYDRERVYDSDIRKLFKWYNILVDAGFTTFEEEKKEDAGTPEEKADAEA